MPIITTLDKLTEDDLVRILTEPKNALVKQYKKLLNLDGVELEFSTDALNAIATMALNKNMGARGLRSIMENAMMDIMYGIPSEKNISKVIVTESVITKASDPIIVFEDRQTNNDLETDEGELIDEG